jgi:hypothetical protein
LSGDLGDGSVNAHPDAAAHGKPGDATDHGSGVDVCLEGDPRDGPIVDGRRCVVLHAQHRFTERPSDPTDYLGRILLRGFLAEVSFGGDS